MTMRAPSVELLRALRTINNPSSRALKHHVQQQHLRVSIPSARSRTNFIRPLTTTTRLENASPGRNQYAPKNHDRGPKSTEDTQTDFGAMDVLGHVAAPATSVDACTPDGFHLDNGVKTEGGNGIVLVGGEAFSWQPWTNASAGPNELLDARKGIISFSKESLGLLELLHPKPDLLIVGTGGKLWMLSQETRRYVSEILGCRLDVVDTANAAATYNLLAKERGVEGGAGIGALLLPVGWVGPKPKPRPRR